MENAIDTLRCLLSTHSVGKGLIYYLASREIPCLPFCFPKIWLIKCLVHTAFPVSTEPHQTLHEPFLTTIILAEFRFMSTMNKQLHWTQRVALIRRSLHAASRSGDFTFFKTLQAAGVLEGTNRVAQPSASLDDDADIVLAAMDNLNTGLAYVHQDAFKNVFDNLKESLREENASEETDRSFTSTLRRKKTWQIWQSIR